MLRDVAGNYFRAYYPGRVIKMLKTDATARTIIVYPVVLLVFHTGLYKNDYIIFLAIYLPLLFILYSMKLHPVRLHKMMYLCPMEVSVRKMYVRNSYFFRIFVQMSVAMIGIAILIPFSHCGMISAAEILLNDLIMSILIPSVKKKDENLGNIDKEMVYRMVMILMPLFLNLGQWVVISDREFHDKESHVIFKLVNAGCLVLILLPLFVKYWKYVKDELAAAVYYEED